MPSRGGLVVGDDDDSKRRSELQEHTRTKKRRLYHKVKNRTISWVLNFLRGIYGSRLSLENRYYGFPLHLAIRIGPSSRNALFFIENCIFKNFNLIYMKYKEIARFSFVAHYAYLFESSF